MTMLSKLRNVAFAAVISLLPLAAHATSQVRLESKLGVANPSVGETTYKASTNAKTDETVQVQLWYHNMENADSGKVANNLKAKIQLPTATGKTQKINGTISADNANTVNTSATANLALDNSRLEYVPGTAVWRHNKGTNEQPNWVTDSLSTTQEQQLLTGGVVLENGKPCFNFEASVSVKLRVKTDMVSITKQVRVLGEKEWKSENTAKAGDTLEYLITFKNEGNTVLKNLALADNMPAHVSYVNGTTQAKNMNNPNGVKITSNNITTGGIDVGSYAPGSVGYVWFQAKVDPNLKPGTYTLKNVAGVKVGSLMRENYAYTKIVVAGKPTPTPTTPPVTPTPTTPTTPEQPKLPQTGIEAGVAGLLGTSGLTYAGYFYRKSRKGLSAALKNVVK